MYEACVILSLSSVTIIFFDDTVRSLVEETAF
jgi:hypothetical protein